MLQAIYRKDRSHVDYKHLRGNVEWHWSSIGKKDGNFAVNTLQYAASFATAIEQHSVSHMCFLYADTERSHNAVVMLQ